MTDSIYSLNYGQNNVNPMAQFSSLFQPMQSTAAYMPELPYIPSSGMSAVPSLQTSGGGFMSSIGDSLKSFSNWGKDVGLIGSTDAKGVRTDGMGSLALGLGQGLFNGWLGMQQLGLAKDTLNANKEQFSKNFAAQQKTTNARLEDRQRARVASNAGAYQSVGDYMQQNRI